MPTARLTHIGGPTLLIEVAGLRILTDPTFDPAGGHYRFGWGTASDKLAGPALTPDDVGDVDVALVSHDHHEDNLDTAGRAFLSRAGTVVTTVPGARRLGGGARGLAPWDTLEVPAPGGGSVTITATPCRHGPPGSRPIVGAVIGFAIALPGRDDVLWISGDTVLYDEVRAVGDRLNVDVAVLHVGGVRFPISGPFRYTMTGADAVELAEALQPRVAIPIHCEGWKHFRDGRSGVEQALEGASPATRERFRWLPIGEPVDV